MKEVQATAVLGHTLVGYSTDTFPISGRGGNCFSVATNDGRLRILNFGYENLEELQRQGLSWPLKCIKLDEGLGVVADNRIGDRWYSATFCEACTPRNWLPTPQRLRQLREIDRGARDESRVDMVSFKSVLLPQFP